MALWIVIGLLGFGKVVMASVMLWVTLRNDDAKIVDEEVRPDSEEDGGSKVLADPVRDPHPRRPSPSPHKPRRGPHGSPSPHTPPRIRVGTTRAIARDEARR
jgi:hypothetical protein